MTGQYLIIAAFMIIAIISKTISCLAWFMFLYTLGHLEYGKYRKSSSKKRQTH